MDLRGSELTVMGCKGSKVQILPFRPIQKSRVSGFFNVCIILSTNSNRECGVAMSANNPDQIYAQQREVIERFSFDQQVVSVFPDMIRRSVPGYATIVEMTGVLAARYAKPNTNLYDLGCSLGASSLAMAKLVQQDGCRIVSVDNSAAMIDQATALISQSTTATPIELHLADVLGFPLTNASVAVMNFTLQFIAAEKRDALVTEIAQSLAPGGIFVLSEKIRFEDDAEDAIQQSMHHAFKFNNGYSQLEISQKRTALENVLIPETIAEHRQRLINAGFQKVHVWFHCFNFMSLVAFR